MEFVILPVSLATAAAAAMVNVWLAVRISRMRLAARISIGDGGNAGLIARMRAHANFVEYAPVVLILIALLELAAANRGVLWAVAVVFLAGRVAHVFGMDRPAPNILRAGGTTATLLVTLGLAGWAAWKVYDGL